jgi:hypothetical protein
MFKDSKEKRDYYHRWNHNINWYYLTLILRTRGRGRGEGDHGNEDKEDR